MTEEHTEYFLFVIYNLPIVLQHYAFKGNRKTYEQDLGLVFHSHMLIVFRLCLDGGG